MKKSAISLLTLVLAVGFADRGDVIAAELTPASGFEAPAVPSTALSTPAPLDASTAAQSTFIAPGASSGNYNASVDANAQLNGSLDAPGTYGSAPAPRTPNVYNPNEIPTSRGMAPGSSVLDSNTAGRILNNSYSGDWFDYCGPNGNTCCSQIYGAVDVWLLDRKDATLKGIAVNSATGALSLSTADPNFRWDKIVPRLTVGRLFCDWAIEGSAIYKDDIAAHVDAINTITGNNAIFFGEQPAGSNYTNATAIRLDIYDEFHSYELNAIDTSSFFQFIYGLRYIEFRETLAVRSTSATGTSNASIGTNNRMIGGQVGLRMEYLGEIADFEFNVKGGIYQNDCNISTNARDINNTILIRSVHSDGQNEAYLAEANLFLTYRMTNNIKARLGWQVMYIGELALAGDQIDPNRTATNTTGFFADAKGDMFMHGFSGGLEYRF